MHPRSMLAAFCCLMFLPLSVAFAQNAALLKVKKISVQETNPKGKAWDAFGGAPDPIVQLQKKSILGWKTIVTVKGIKDRFKGEYPVKKQKPFLVKVGERIRIRVYDEDPVGSDFIGERVITITADDLKKGRIILTKRFGRVKSLEIEFSK